MNEIVAQSSPDEARDAERLLGVLTTLSAFEDDTLTFVAPRGTSAIVDRALAQMARSDRHHARALRTRNRM
jgi:hypothetical protein